MSGTNQAIPGSSAGFSLTVTKLDLVFLYALSGGACVALLMLLVNTFVGHYTVINFLHGSAGGIALLMIQVYIASLLLIFRFPRVCFFAKSMGMFALVTQLSLVLLSGVAVTPFPLYDAFFQRVDHFMGFYLLDTLRFVDGYSWLKFFIRHAYNSLMFAVFLVLISLAVIQEKKQIYRYMIAFIIAITIGCSIAYFVPSTAPQSLLHDFKFMQDQLFLLNQYNAIHSYEVIRSPSPAIIGFPSFHTVWPSLLLYAVWNNKMLRWPAMIYAALIPVVALLAGWHFLIDIIGGFALAALSIYIAERILRDYKESD